MSHSASFGDNGLLDPRRIFAQRDVTGQSRGRTADFEPGQEAQLRGLNAFQQSRRRTRGARAALFGTSNQVGLSQALVESGAQADRSFDVAEGSLARRQGGLGLRLSERAKRSQKRNLNLSRSIAKSSATNATRRGFKRRAEGANRAARGLEDAAFGVESQGLIQFENAFGQRRIREEAEKSAKSQSRDELISTGIGLIASLAMFSSEDYKHDKRPQTSLLDKLKKIRIDKWKYVGDETDHIGPYAEEFNEAFGVGQDSKQQISIIDAIGVTMGAVKELSERLDGQH